MTPVVCMCDESEYKHLNALIILVSNLNSYPICCIIIFRLRCNMPQEDDVVIEKLLLYHLHILDILKKPYSIIASLVHSVTSSRHSAFAQENQWSTDILKRRCIRFFCCITYLSWHPDLFVVSTAFSWHTVFA